MSQVLSTAAESHVSSHSRCTHCFWWPALHPELSFQTYLGTEVPSTPQFWVKAPLQSSEKGGVPAQHSSLPIACVLLIFESAVDKKHKRPRTSSQEPASSPLHFSSRRCWMAAAQGKLMPQAGEQGALQAFSCHEREGSMDVRKAVEDKMFNKIFILVGSISIPAVFPKHKTINSGFFFFFFQTTKHEIMSNFYRVRNWRDAALQVLNSASAAKSGTFDSYEQDTSNNALLIMDWHSH